METKKAARTEPEAEPKVPETPQETSEAVQRIKEAVSDTKQNMAEEKAGTKAPHVPVGWAKNLPEA